MRHTKEEEIYSLDEIEYHSIKYWLVDENRQRTGKWVHIELNYDGGEKYFSVNRKIYAHQLYDFEVSGDFVRSWKTLSGAIRFIKREYAKWVR